MPIRFEKKWILFGPVYVSYECEGCGESLKNPAKEIGRKDSCPHCGAKFKVPGKDEYHAWQWERGIAKEQIKAKIEEERDYEFASRLFKIESELEDCLAERQMYRYGMLVEEQASLLSALGQYRKSLICRMQACYILIHGPVDATDKRSSGWGSNRGGSTGGNAISVIQAANDADIELEELRDIFLATITATKAAVRGNVAPTTAWKILASELKKEGCDL